MLHRLSALPHFVATVSLMLTALPANAGGRFERRAVRNSSGKAVTVSVENAVASCLTAEPVGLRDMDGVTVLVANLRLSKSLRSCGCRSAQVAYELCESYGREMTGHHKYCEQRASAFVNAANIGSSPKRVLLAVGGSGMLERPGLRLRCEEGESEAVNVDGGSPPVRSPSTEDERLEEMWRKRTDINTAVWVDATAAARAEQRWGLSSLRLKRSRVAQCVDIRFRDVVSSENLVLADVEITTQSPCPCKGDTLGYTVFERAATGAAPVSDVLQMVRLSTGQVVPPDPKHSGSARWVLAADGRDRFGEILIEVRCVD